MGECNVEFGVEANSMLALLKGVCDHLILVLIIQVGDVCVFVASCGWRKLDNLDGVYLLRFGDRLSMTTC